MREASANGPGLERARSLLDEALVAIERDPAASFARSAVRLARAALDARAVDPEELIRTGLLLEEQGRFEIAAEYYEEAAAIDPTSARSWTNLGEVRRRLSRWDDALRAYDAALQHQPGYLWALAGRAEALRMLGQLEACVDPFQRALERAPDHVLAVQGLAAALSELGRHREALALWERALRLRPESGFASDGLARCQDALAAEAAPS